MYRAALARQEEQAKRQEEQKKKQKQDEQQQQQQQQQQVDADPAVVIAADTVIATRSGQILEKPRSEAEHGRMLRRLRDEEQHRVLTGVSVLAPREDAAHPGYALATHVEETRVVFGDSPDDVLDSYVRTREGADKAGGYALQGVGGALLVDRVEGSVDNVIGLPVRRCLELCEKVVFRQEQEGEEEGEGEDDDDDDVDGREGE